MSINLSCDFVLTRALFYEYSAGLSKHYKTVQHAYCAVFAVFFGILTVAYWKASVTASAVTAVLSIMCLVSIFWGYRLNAKMNYERLEYIHKGAPHIHVAFSEHNIANSSDINCSTISYEAINRIFETKQLVVLVIENEKCGHQSVIVQKEKLCGGTSEALLEYLNGKCVNIRIPKIFDFIKKPR